VFRISGAKCRLHSGAALPYCYGARLCCCRGAEAGHSFLPVTRRGREEEDLVEFFFTARKEGFLIPGAAGLLRQAEAFCSAVDSVQDSRLPGQNLALRGEISAGFEVSFLQRCVLPC